MLTPQADLYREGKSYNDAYILYIRFLDLLMNKLSHHPLIKKDPELHESYIKLVNQKAPQAFQSAEDVKSRIEGSIALYESTLARVEEQKKQDADIKRKREELEHAGEAKRPARENSPEFDELKFEEHLRQYRAAGSESSHRVMHHGEADYPSLPQSHISVPKTGAPPLPPKMLDVPPAAQKSDIEARANVQHKCLASTEGGKLLKTVFLPSSLQESFLNIARPNTAKKLETCGILCGKLSLNAFFITTLVIPEQESTENTCQTKDEETLFEYMDSNDLFVLGWIHTHPTQSCFLSSVDLHTQNSYQIMLPEAIAIVCAPTKSPNSGIFRLTDPPGVSIITKCRRTGFHPHEETGLYKNCDRRHDAGHVVTKDALPFETTDLRK